MSDDDRPPRHVMARATPGVRQAFIEVLPDGSERAWLHDEHGDWRLEPGLETRR